MRVLGAVWRWSWVVTLPVTVVFAVWLHATASRYVAFTLRQPSGFQLRGIGAMELDHMLRRAELLLSSAGDAGRLRAVRLEVPGTGLARLDADLPHSGYTYVDGVLQQDGRRQDVEVRYRGDSAYHWAYDKKSFRVQTRRSELFEGMRTFNLVAPRTPEILNNHLSHLLAERFGLVSPHTEMVEVFLGGSLHGLYVLTEQLREITLLRAGRTPGDLYSGDLVGLAAWRGVDNALFRHPGLWEVQGGEDGPEGRSNAPLWRLLELVRAPPSDHVHSELGRLLDVEAFGRFNALEILSATVHVDGVHNWRLHYDPYRGRFEPAVWDLMGWHYLGRPGSGEPARLDVVSSPLHVALHGNGDFLRARHAALRGFFESGADREFLAEVAASIEAVGPAVRRDPNVFVAGEVLRPERSLAAMLELSSEIARFFAEIRAAYLEDPGEVRWAAAGGGTVALTVDGRRPVERIALEYDGPIPAEPEVRVRFWRDDEVVEVDVSGGASARGSTLDLAVPLLARFVPRIESMRPILVENNRVSVEPAYYELAVAGLPPGRALREVRVQRGGADAVAARAEELSRIPFGEAFALVTPFPRREAPVWEGEVTVTATREIERAVTILPGTTVRLAPGASLVFRGRVTAAGTADRPVRFLPLTPDGDPWGVVILLGPGTAGSRLAHCEFAGGSAARTDFHDWPGMLSLHDTRDVALQDCVLRDNRVADDALHGAYVEDLRLTRCAFTGALYDALDLDRCSVTIEACRFTGSGADAIELNGSAAVIVDTSILRNGAAGIAAGGGSRAVVLCTRSSDNAVAFQCVDGSVAALCNVDLVDCATGLSCLAEDWRFDGGGRAFVYKARIEGNRESLAADDRSAIHLGDSFVDRLPEEGGPVTWDASVDSGLPTTARLPVVPRHPDEVRLLEQLGADPWSKAVPALRGAPPGR